MSRETAQDVSFDADVDTAIGRRRSVLRQQGAVTGAAVTVLLLLLVLTPPSAPTGRDSFLAWGLLALLCVSVVAALVPWDRLDGRWVLVVPVVDVAVLGLLRIGQPEAGFGVIMTIPVIWLAGSRSWLGPALGAVAPAVTLLLQLALERSPLLDVARPTSTAATGSIILTLAFVSGAVATTHRALRTHRTLLHEQSLTLTESLRHVRRQEKALRSIMDAVPFGMFTLDPEGRITHSNVAASRLFSRFGVTRETPLDSIPLHAADGTSRLGPEDFPMARAVRGEEVDEIIWLGRRDGPRAAIQIKAQVLLDDDGRIDRIVIVTHDMTEQLASERRRDNLVSSLSHEFRTPLSSVLGYLDLVLDDPELPARTHGHLDVARRNAERMQSLVGDLLITRSKEAQTPQLVLEHLDLTEVVQEAVRSLEPVAASRGVAIEVGAAQRSQVLGDAFRLRQVVDNVLSNAVKYNSPGGRVCVEVVPQEAHGWALVVDDTGPGMEQADLDRLFEPFFRSETARRSGAPGTGLGLTIVREIVEQHGGSIDVLSTLGSGTTVRILLPRDTGLPSAEGSPRDN